MMPNRVLLVEDDPVIGLDLRWALEDAGCEVIGPVARLAEALTAIEAESFTVAVLDFEIIGGSSQAVAERLAARGTPFLFYTAAVDRVRELWPDRRIISKPESPANLTRAAAELGTV